MKNRLKVLLTCIGGELSYQFVKMLKASNRYDYFIVGVDTSIKPITSYICDKFINVPHGNDENYAQIILEICSKYKIDIVFPGSDEEVLALASHKDELITIGTILACNDLSIIEIISNKAKTYEKLSSFGIPTPRWHSTSALDEIEYYVHKIYNDLGSVVVKLPDGRGSRGIYVIRNDIKGSKSYFGTREIHLDMDHFLNDVLKLLDPLSNYIVMQRLEEPVFDLDILAWEGKVINAIPRKRLFSARPNDGHIIVDEKEMIEIGEKIVKNLNMSWLFDIDFMKMGDGTPCVLEINPRASGSVSVSILAGTPLFENMISLIKNEKILHNVNPINTIVHPYTALEKLEEKSRDK